MKIVHVCLNGPVTDGWSYQENLLSKYHCKAGHTVDLIASRYIWSDQGKMELSDRYDYYNEDGIHMIRLRNILGTTVRSKIRLYSGLYKQLTKSKPDILFIHGVQFVGISSIVSYLRKHPAVKVYVDNHADFSNSATNWFSREILHKQIWRYYAKKIEPFTTKFYGVLPARVDFMEDIYQLPPEKLELLVMGVDDEALQMSPQTISETRAAYGISPEDKLLVTGGKIDLWKQQTLLLMDAVNQMERTDVKLIVFGSVVDELKEAVSQRCSEKVQYIGWLNAEESDRLFASSQLVVFPGRHSVFWEQVAGLGVPMAVKEWNGTTHVDCGGNVRFLTEDTAEEMQAVIGDIFQADHYEKMLQSAKNASINFRYSEIARRSIES